MTKVTVLYPAMAVHAFGCSDAAKALSRGHDTKSRTNVDGSQDFEAATPEAALLAVVADLNAGGDWERPWRVSDLHVYPCVTKGPVLAKPLPPDACPGSGQSFGPTGGRLYMPCPVCGKWLGTGRGVVPRHKRPAR